MSRPSIIPLFWILQRTTYHLGWINTELVRTKPAKWLWWSVTVSS